jgi:hypothetical protein
MRYAMENERFMGGYFRSCSPCLKGRRGRCASEGGRYHPAETGWARDASLGRCPSVGFALGVAIGEPGALRFLEQGGLLWVELLRDSWQTRLSSASGFFHSISMQPCMSLVETASLHCVVARLERRREAAGQNISWTLLPAPRISSLGA